VIKIALFAAFSSLFVFACSSDSSSDGESNNVHIVTLALNLPFNSALLDTLKFNRSQTATYTNSTSLRFTNSDCNSTIFAFYFVHTAPLIWDVYTYIDQSPVNIQNGSVGSFGQYKATLEFDHYGKLAKLTPATVVSADVGATGKSPVFIQIDWGKSGDTSAYAAPFAVYKLTTFSACAN
jgi:hypothetical protein